MRDRFKAAARQAAMLALVAAGVAARPAAAANGPQVQQAIDRGKAFLFANQVNGNWELVPKPDPEVPEPFEVRGLQWGGPTAIATLALLSAGVDANDPRIKRAVEFLDKADLKGTYAVGLRAQVWNLLAASPATRQAGLTDLNLLLNGTYPSRSMGAGMYGYRINPPRPANPTEYVEWDHSVSQFAVLGTWSLAQQGLEVPTAYWRTVDAAWHAHEQQDGSWFYRTEANGKPHHTTDLSMTAAGVATLFITQEYTQIAPRCSGNLSDPGITAGLKYLGDHLNDLTDDRRYYTLFGVSRVGLASGYKYLGKTDWFDWGADQLVQKQGRDGSWRNAHASEAINGVADTAFGLLFLSRGRLPVMVNKLEYDVTAGTGKAAKPTPATWNQRPRDVANLSRWVGRQLESPLNWQVVNLHASADDLHDAPLLYMAGGKAPKLSPGDVDKLRAYVEDGGLLVGHADCGSPEFAKGFAALGEQMFPGRKFRPLEATHPIYVNETFPRSKWKGKVSLDGLSNGCRELMLLLPPTDPAKVWQSQSFQSVKNDTAGQLMIDLFLYAVDKEGLRRRGETYVVDRRNEPASKPVNVARVKYAGNFNPEPGGWRRLANVLHNDRVADLTVTVVDPAAGGKLDARQFPLAVLTIADADAQLTDPVRSAVRDYVNAGGTLLVDAAGGHSACRTAAEAEIAKMFPAAPHELPVLGTDDPVYTSGGPKLAVKTVDFRRFERSGRMAHDPRLRGYAVGGRTAVIYSPEDVSVGLVGQPIDGVAGYAPADATKVVTAVVAYAAKLR